MPYPLKDFPAINLVSHLNVNLWDFVYFFDHIFPVFRQFIVRWQQVCLVE